MVKERRVSASRGRCDVNARRADGRMVRGDVTAPATTLSQRYLPLANRSRRSPVDPSSIAADQCCCCFYRRRTVPTRDAVRVRRNNNNIIIITELL